LSDGAKLEIRFRHFSKVEAAVGIPFLIALIVLPLYAEGLNHNKFLGFPLGYLLAAQGLFLIALVTIGGFVNRQDAIDHWHGAHEDN